MPTIQFPDGTAVDLGDTPTPEVKAKALAKFQRMASATTTPISEPSMLRETLAPVVGPRGAVAAEQILERFIPPAPPRSDLPRTLGAVGAGTLLSRAPLPLWLRALGLPLAEALGGGAGETGQILAEQAAGTTPGVPPGPVGPERPDPMARVNEAAKLSGALSIPGAAGVGFAAATRPRPGPIRTLASGPAKETFSPLDSPEIEAAITRTRSGLEAEATNQMQAAVRAEQSFAPKLNRELTTLERTPAREVPLPGGRSRIIARGQPITEPSPRITQSQVPSTVQALRERARQATTEFRQYADRFPPEQSGRLMVIRMAKDPELLAAALDRATPQMRATISRAVDAVQEFRFPQARQVGGTPPSDAASLSERVIAVAGPARIGIATRGLRALGHTGDPDTRLGLLLTTLVRGLSQAAGGSLR